MSTLALAVVTGPVGFLLCLFLAWLVNEFSPKLRAVMTLLFYAPSISGGVYMIWSLIYSGDSYGLLNGLLMGMGVIYEPVQWLTDPRYDLGIVIVVQLWLSLGTSFLAFIAGFKQLNASYFEAAAIDGLRNRWQELWYITLPQMKPQLLFGCINAITASFADCKNAAALHHVKQILLSSFTNNTAKNSSGDILAIPPEQRDNNSGGSPYVP